MGIFWGAPTTIVIAAAEITDLRSTVNTVMKPELWVVAQKLIPAGNECVMLNKEFYSIFLSYTWYVLGFIYCIDELPNLFLTDFYLLASSSYFLKVLFYAHWCFTRIHVSVTVQIPWNWRYRQMWAAPLYTVMLGIEPQASGRAASSCNCWAIFTDLFPSLSL